MKVKMISGWARMGLIVLAAFNCFCATGPRIPAEPSRTEAGPAPFEPAVRMLAENLLNLIAVDRGAGEGRIRVVMEPFRNADTAEVPHAARDIERIFSAVSDKINGGMTVSRLDTSSLERADYLIEGAIGLRVPDDDPDNDPDNAPDDDPDNDPDNASDNATYNYPYNAPDVQADAGDQRRYYVSAAVVNLRERKPICRSTAWIANGGLNAAPIALYQDCPVFYKEWRQSLAAADPEGHLKVRAAMTEAETAYDNGDYEAAMALFRSVESPSAAHALPIYGGIYATSLKMGRMEMAEAAFGEIVRLSVERFNALTVKFLFKVNTADFHGGPAQRRIYEMWLRRIGAYFHEADRCMKIIGHSSPTGTPEWNDRLSLERARSARRLLAARYPDMVHRSRAEGRGFRENIIGIGTDDDRDALDRRVEIAPVECDRL